MSRMNRFLSLFLGALWLIGGCSDDTSKPLPDTTSPKLDGKVGTDGSAGTCSTLSLLPADNAVGDYKRKAAPEVATDAKSLQDIVDGGSEKYTNNKFVCMTRVYLTSTTKSAEIEVWAFDQSDQAGAKGAMDIATTSMTDITPPFGDAAKENLGLVTGWEAFARKGKTLVRVFVNKKDAREDALNAAKAVITAAP